MRVRAHVRGCATYIGAWRKKLDRSRTRGATTVSLVFSLSDSPTETLIRKRSRDSPGDEEETKKTKRERERGQGKGGGGREGPPPKSPSASSEQLPRVRDAESYTLDTAAPHSGYMACHPEYYSSRLTAQSVNARYCLTRFVRREADQT